MVRIGFTGEFYLEPSRARLPSKMRVYTSDCVACEINPHWSHLLMNMVGLEGPIPLPNVDSMTLGKLKYWQEMSDEDPIDEPWDTLWSMAHAADYLDMPAMLDKTCRALAGQLKGKRPSEIHKLIKP